MIVTRALFGCGDWSVEAQTPNEKPQNPNPEKRAEREEKGGRLLVAIWRSGSEKRAETIF